MTNQHYRLGGDVFEKYSPHYDSYRGHIFKIDHYHFNMYPEEECNDHVWLTCVDMPELKVAGYIELCNLVPVIFVVVYIHPWSARNNIILKSFESYSDALEYQKLKIEEYAERAQDSHSCIEEAYEYYEKAIKVIDVDYKVSDEVFPKYEAIHSTKD